MDGHSAKRLNAFGTLRFPKCQGCLIPKVDLEALHKMGRTPIGKNGDCLLTGEPQQCRFTQGEIRSHTVQNLLKCRAELVDESRLMMFG